MIDLLDLIAQQQDAIVQRWHQDILALPSSPYHNVDGDALLASVRRSSGVLIDVMRSGDTTVVEAMLRESARRRKIEGVSFSDSAAVWLLYRQAVHEIMKASLTSVEIWEEMIDRVDAVLDWVVRVLHLAYRD